jgi:hypothetical protein
MSRVSSTDLRPFMRTMIWRLGNEGPALRAFQRLKGPRFQGSKGPVACRSFLYSSRYGTVAPGAAKWGSMSRVPRGLGRSSDVGFAEGIFIEHRRCSIFQTTCSGSWPW